MMDTTCLRVARGLPSADVVVGYRCQPGELARLLDFPDPRQVDDGLWRMGRYHGRMMYYAEEPTDGLLARLQNDRQAVFVYAKVGDGFGKYPENCVCRGRALSEVVRFGHDGTLLPDEAELDRLAHKRTSGILHGRRGNGEAVAVRRTEWMAFMRFWYGKLREEQTARRPQWKEIAQWFHTCAAASVRREKPSVRTLQRDVRTFVAWNGRGEDLRWSDFAILWNRADDIRFVLNESDRALADIVAAAFARVGVGCCAEAIRPLPGGRHAFQPVS